MSVAPAIESAILDANGIIGLAKRGCLALLPRLFSSAFVPVLVIDEITDAVSADELRAALANWLVAESPTSQSMQAVPQMRSEADRSVLALALDHFPCFVITGDRALRNRAARLQSTAISAPRIVQLLAESGLIAAAKPHLDRMMASGFGIPQVLYDAILGELGEG